MFNKDNLLDVRGQCLPESQFQLRLIVAILFCQELPQKGIWYILGVYCSWDQYIVIFQKADLIVTAWQIKSNQIDTTERQLQCMNA
jgi:hypothetical protein